MLRCFGKNFISQREYKNSLLSYNVYNQFLYTFISLVTKFMSAQIWVLCRRFRFRKLEVFC